MIRTYWFILAHLMPRRLVYTCLLRAVDCAMTNAGTKNPQRLTAADVMDNWREVIAGMAREKR